MFLLSILRGFSPTCCMWWASSRSHSDLSACMFWFLLAIISPTDPRGYLDISLSKTKTLYINPMKCVAVAVGWNVFTWLLVQSRADVTMPHQMSKRYLSLPSTVPFGLTFTKPLQPILIYDDWGLSHVHCESARWSTVWNRCWNNKHEQIIYVYCIKYIDIH